MPESPEESLVGKRKAPRHPGVTGAAVGRQVRDVLCQSRVRSQSALCCPWRRPAAPRPSHPLRPAGLPQPSLSPLRTVSRSPLERGLCSELDPEHLDSLFLASHSLDPLLFQIQLSRSGVHPRCSAALHGVGCSKGDGESPSSCFCEESRCGAERKKHQLDFSYPHPPFSFSQPWL